VPEIDMPAHTNAALATYPELNCDGRAPGPRTDMAVGYSSLCVSKPVTYRFVEDVIREIAELTPGPYLHVGGDEAQSTTDADYRAFLTRVLALPPKHGKRAIGWHEIAKADPPPAAVAQYWRVETSDAAVARAAARGGQVIMSPAQHTYLDMKYDPTTQPGLTWAGVIDVRQAYDWDPATTLRGVGERSVLGVEAPMWSETLRSRKDVQTMAFPRLPAIAELGWSPRASHDWVSLRARLAGFGPRWTRQGVAFHRSAQIPWE
jgi:hexosaminidase